MPEFQIRLNMEIFYSENLTEQSKQMQLTPDESRHLLKALRKKSGDSIQITNGQGLLAEAVIMGEKSKAITCNIQSVKKLPSPPEKKIHIAISTIRPKRMDWAVEKLTELGVGTISFFNSQFTSVRSFKAGHLMKIAISAIKQSQQAYLPQLNPPLPFAKWLQSLDQAENQTFFLAHLNNNVQKMKFENIYPGRQSPIVVAIGPEGGFSEEELTMACERGFRLVSLDNHILRAETAAVISAVLAKQMIRKEVEKI